MLIAAITPIAMSDAGWLSSSDAEFRLVRTARGTFAFDIGERPEIDGAEYTDPAAAAARLEELRSRGHSSIHDRNGLPHRLRDNAPDSEQELGRIRWEYEAWRLPLVGNVAFLESVDPTVTMYGGLRYRQGEHEHYDPAPPTTEDLAIIADYLDRCYPGSGYGARVRAGLRPRVRVQNGAMPFLWADAATLLVGCFMLRLRRRPAQQNGPAQSDRPE